MRIVKSMSFGAFVILSFLVLTIYTLPSPALAAQDASTPGDKNGDGKVDLSELVETIQRFVNGEVEISYVMAAISCFLESEQTPLVLINEVMIDPVGSDSGNEQVELYNAGNKSQNLKGWTISDIEGEVIADLPDLELAGGTYLVVHLDTRGELLANSEDAVALYSSKPGKESIVDCVVWSSKGSFPSGSALDFALAAGILENGDFVDTSFETGRTILPGFSIGRDKNSTDTDKSSDWNTFGGTNAFGSTMGKENAGPPFSTSDAIFMSQMDINNVLQQYEYGGSLADFIYSLLSQQFSENELSISTDHRVVLETPEQTVDFLGDCEFRWEPLGPSSWRIDTKVTLASDSRSISLTFQTTRIMRGLRTLTLTMERELSGDLSHTDGTSQSFSRMWNRELRQTGANTFLLAEKASFTGPPAPSMTAQGNWEIERVPDGKYRSSGNIVWAKEGEIQSLEGESTQEFGADGLLSATINQFTVRRGNTVVSLAEPASVTERFIQGDFGEPGGKLEFTMRWKLGNGVVGFPEANIMQDLEWNTQNSNLQISGNSTATWSEREWSKKFSVNCDANAFERDLSHRLDVLGFGWGAVCIWSPLLLPAMDGDAAFSAGICRSGGAVFNWLMNRTREAQIQ